MASKVRVRVSSIINAAGVQLKGIILSWVSSFYKKINEFIIAIDYTNLGQQKNCANIIQKKNVVSTERVYSFNLFSSKNK